MTPVGNTPLGNAASIVPNPKWSLSPGCGGLKPSQVSNSWRSLSIICCFLTCISFQIWDYKVMLIFLAFSFTFLHFFSTFVFMRKKLFDDLPKSLKLSGGIWLRIFPDSGEGYRLYDPLEGREMGRVLFDKA